MKKAGDKLSKDLGIGLAQVALPSLDSIPLTGGKVQPVVTEVDPICLDIDFLMGATPDADDDENCEYFSVNPEKCQFAE